MMNTLTKTSNSCPQYQPKIFTPETNKELKIVVNKWISNKDNVIKLYGDINEWNTENITDMSYLFYEARLFNENISNWNTLNVIDMSYMFYNAENFNQYLNNWDVSNVKSIKYMFYQCRSFTHEIRWDNINNITNYDYAFTNYSNRNHHKYIIRMIENNIENNKIKCCIIM